MPPPEIADIIEKYKKNEEIIENTLTNLKEKCSQDHQSNHSQFPIQFPDAETAKQRNTTILKDLETVKGNLRSKAIFSPTELQWEEICKRYQLEPALPVTTWRCNLPAFV